MQKYLSQSAVVFFLPCEERGRHAGGDRCFQWQPAQGRCRGLKESTPRKRTCRRFIAVALASGRFALADIRSEPTR